MRNGEGGRPAASSSVPKDERPGSNPPTLSPLRPLLMSALSIADVGWSEGGGGSIGSMVRAGGISELAAIGPSHESRIIHPYAELGRAKKRRPSCARRRSDARR